MIKFVYFDIGGVAILDFSGTDSWEKLMTEIGIKKKYHESFKSYWDTIDSEISSMSDIDILVPAIENKFKIKFPKDYSFLVDGFVRKFCKNETIWPVIKEVKKTCKIGLLTNMYPKMLPEILKAKLLPEVKWDEIIDSSIEKVQKPVPGVFRLAEERCGFKGEDILFVDNTKRHLDGAEKFNWQTFLYDPKNPEKSSKNLLEYFRRNRGVKIINDRKNT